MKTIEDKYGRKYISIDDLLSSMRLCKDTMGYSRMNISDFIETLVEIQNEKPKLTCTLKHL